MSLILGVNLSDGVYLSADTRLTFRVGQQQKYLDTFLKVKPLSQEIIVVVAGSARMASFIVKGLITSDINKTDIRKFRSDIEEYVKKLALSYEKKYGQMDKVFFIFAGINRGEKKKIILKKYFELMEVFRKETDAPMNIKDTIFQGFPKKSGQVTSPLTIPAPDSHVFSIEVLPDDLIVRDTNWGEFVARGPRKITEGNFPPRFFGQLEIAAKPANWVQHDKMWLDIFMKTVADENNLTTVGGCTTSFIVSEKYSGILLGVTGMRNLRTGVDEIVSEVKIINKKLHCLIGGEMQRLTPFILYEDMLLGEHPTAEHLML